VAFGFHLVPSFFDFSVRADQKGAANNPLERAAHEFFRAPRAERFNHLVGRIADQRKIQFLLGLETL